MIRRIGPVPFLRAVAPANRRMTTVYHFSRRVRAPAADRVFLPLFLAFGFPGAFAALALLLAAMGAHAALPAARDVSARQARERRAGTAT